MPQRKRLNQRKRYSSEDMNFHMPRVTKSLEACWPLRKSGAPIFASDGGSVLAPVNTPTFGWQGAHYIKASTQYSRLAEADWRSGDSAGTISARIKLDSVGAVQDILTSSDEVTNKHYLVFGVRAGGQLWVGALINNVFYWVLGGTALVADTWYHVAATSNSSTWGLFVNGVPETITIGGESNTGDWFADVGFRDNVIIGCVRRTTNLAYFDGTIRDVCYYSRALSAGEVIACMHPTT